MKKSLLFNKYFKESYFKYFFVIRFSKKMYKSLKRINSSLLLLTNHHKEVLIKENFSESRLFILPNYIGLGNGITRGYGTLFSLNNSLSSISSEIDFEFLACVSSSCKRLI